MVKAIADIENHLKTRLFSYRVTRRKKDHQPRNQANENDQTPKLQTSPTIDALWSELELAFLVFFRNLNISRAHLSRISRKAMLEAAAQLNANSPIKSSDTDSKKHGLMLHIRNMEIKINSSSRISCSLLPVVLNVIPVNETPGPSRLVYRNINEEFMLPKTLIRKMNRQAEEEKLTDQNTVFMIKKCSTGKNEDINIIVDIFHAFHAQEISQSSIRDIFNAQAKSGVIGEKLMHQIIYGEISHVKLEV